MAISPQEQPSTSTKAMSRKRSMYPRQIGSNVSLIREVCFKVPMVTTLSTYLFLQLRVVLYSV